MTGIASMSITAHVRKLTSRPRERNDFYRTPPAATQALLQVETFPQRVWEPACGDGAMSRVLDEAGHTVVSTDLFDHGYGHAPLDFLATINLLGPAALPCAVITNPPFRLIDEFALHALALGASKVALLGRLAWLEGGKRHAKLWGPHPPARVWVFSKRQTLWRGDDADAKTTGGAIAFGWFVWERGHNAGPVLGWLS